MDRKKFLTMAGLSTLSFTHLSLKGLAGIAKDYSTTKKMPTLFLAHGHPINAVLKNKFTETLATVSDKIQPPNAIMVISAHWETKGTYVSVNPAPRTIYDFGNFDQRLFDIQYEPDGHPELAKEVIKLNNDIREDNHMGLDHGAWTILKHVYPQANIPVFQLSIDYTQGPEYHYELGKQLNALRYRGVLIVGSGNIVHNLRKLNWGNQNAQPFDWALEFDQNVKQKLYNQQFNDLVNYENMGQSALLSIPTNEHYLPMLYILGFMEKGERIETIYEAYEFGSLSMRSFKIY